MRSEILVHRWGPGTRIYFGAVTSFVFSFLNMVAIIELDVRFRPYKLCLTFHKCISFLMSMVDHATSRNGLVRIFLFALLHNRHHYLCYFSVGHLPSFCTHPNPTEFRPSTSSHLRCQNQKVQSSNYSLCRSAKAPFFMKSFSSLDSTFTNLAFHFSHSSFAFSQVLDDVHNL